MTIHIFLQYSTLTLVVLVLDRVYTLLTTNDYYGRDYDYGEELEKMFQWKNKMFTQEL